MPRLIYVEYLVDSLSLLVKARGCLTNDWIPTAWLLETRAVLDREIVFTCRVHAQDRTSLISVAQPDRSKLLVD